MTALSLAANGAVHTGACLAVPRALSDALRCLHGFLRDAPAPEKEYCLHDEEGHPLGVIRAPEGRPEVGPNAPAVYLQRPR
jgi:hypothetical protein